MTQQEEDRLDHYKQFMEIGKTFFKQIKDYYQNEPMLNISDVYDIGENFLRLNYLYKSYILELKYNEGEKLGQIIVYEAVIGTHFRVHPKFQLKETCQLYYDYPGNIFIGSKQAAYGMPTRSAEQIIREITK